MLKNCVCIFCQESFVARRGNQHRCPRCAGMMGTWGVKDSKLNIQGGKKYGKD